MNDLVARINWLARKKREQGLTPQEEKEQRELRARYLKYIRNQLVDALESAGFKPKGKRRKPAVAGIALPGLKSKESPAPLGISAGAVGM